MDRNIPPELLSRRAEIARICEQLGVRRLELFGSATRATDRPGDLDFLVDLGERPPRERAVPVYEKVGVRYEMVG